MLGPRPLRKLQWNRSGREGRQRYRRLPWEQESGITSEPWAADRRANH